MMNDQRCCVVNPENDWVCGYAPGHGGEHGTWVSSLGKWSKWELKDEQCGVVNPRKDWVCELKAGHTGRTHKTRTESGSDWYDWQVELPSDVGVWCRSINEATGEACVKVYGHKKKHRSRAGGDGGSAWISDEGFELEPTPELPRVVGLAPLPMLKFETIPMFDIPPINVAVPEPGEVVLPWTPPVLSGIVHYAPLEGPQHTCRVPDSDQFGGGTIHRCEGCGKYRRVKLLPLASVRVRKGLFGKSYEQVARTWEDITEDEAMKVIAEGQV